jgi:hypothetical protein
MDRGLLSYSMPDDEDDDDSSRASDIKAAASPIDKYIAELNKVESDLAHSYDKTLTTLAAGAFALSITFIKEIAPQPVGFPALLSAWIAFALSLVTILFGFLLAQFAVRRQASLWLVGTTWDAANRSRRRWSALINGCNCIALVFLVAGMVALVFFAALNFPVKGNVHGQHPEALSPAGRSCR